jgi:hypothetical protein
MSILPPDEAKALLVGIIADFAENDTDNLFTYLKHVGFDIAAIQDTKELLPAWLGHYRIGQGTYDTDKALMDFMTWPPIARRIFELQAEKVKNESLAK